MDSVDSAGRIVAATRQVVDGTAARLAAATSGQGRVDAAAVDREQVLAYDLASVAAMLRAAESLLDRGRDGDLEADLALAFAGDVAATLQGKAAGRAEAWGTLDELAEVAEELAAARAPTFLDELAGRVLDRPELPRGLDEELAMVRAAFGDFADAKVAPVAERVHRGDEDIPEDVIAELAAMGCFGLSIPETYGGFAQGEGGADDLLSMVVVTEELSRASLGVAGSLITRPEILSRALLEGGTEEQKGRWLPRIASGELMCAVAVTEPDFGSDVANLAVTATRRGEHYVVNGVKTWCTFGGRAELLMLLARTGSREDRHRGLSLFVVEKPAYPGHAFTHAGEHGGRIDARAIPTLGYRGMHSFELSFEDFAVPAANLVGGDDALGKGFYLQMGAFANGRLQTAARALGVMQAAFDAAAGYAKERHVFGRPLADYQLSRAKLARMAALVAACRSFTHDTARLLSATGGDGQADAQLDASMVKSFACLSAEWVTREAQQLHGGYGYAEEYAVSRYFVDARVLSIFEGADETLALRVIARRLLEDAAG